MNYKYELKTGVANGSELAAALRGDIGGLGGSREVFCLSGNRLFSVVEPGK